MTRPLRGRRRRVRHLLSVLAAGLAATLPAPAGSAAYAAEAHGAQAPTVYIASDSTAQTYTADYAPQAGWGQMLGRYLSPRVRVANHAMGGRSSRSFVDEGRLRTILERIRPGDVLLVQFGHNDSLADPPERHTTPEQYKELLRTAYIRGAERRGATPVVITPVSQRDVDPATGRFRRAFAAYADKAAEVAREEHVPLVDLGSSSRRYLDSLGAEAAKDVFLYTRPGQYPGRPDGVADRTHFQAYGALHMARLLARDLRERVPQLARYVRPTVSAVYDFGPRGSPTASSYTPVTDRTPYTAARGYGLSGAGRLTARDRGPRSGLNALRRDFVAGRGAGHGVGRGSEHTSGHASGPPSGHALGHGVAYGFHARVPKGRYDVRVQAADAAGAVHTSVAVEGGAPGRLDAARGKAAVRTFTGVKVADGRLDLRISGRTGHLGAVDILPAA
ncbi:rhamnogalacturonan acetylesterase [Streptomyces sp. ODS28]|uniref:rhamnogalacturonan acetylesterase n=1 Tax=Streptomyces sp. ODS28 TaxID=3136688 RepID=UPI0031EE2984